VNSRAQVDILTGAGNDWHDVFTPSTPKSTTTAPSSSTPSASSNSPAQTTAKPAAKTTPDIWDIASAFTNIDNITSEGKKQEVKTINSGGVTMGQMSELRALNNPAPRPGPAVNDPFSSGPSGAGAGAGAGGGASIGVNAFIDYPANQQQTRPAAPGFISYPAQQPSAQPTKKSADTFQNLSW